MNIVGISLLSAENVDFVSFGHLIIENRGREISNSSISIRSISTSIVRANVEGRRVG